jgi:N4-gp56 family major capsid protein
MAWVWDAPSGTFKNHALSKNIRREAIADVQFMKFLRPEPGYGKGRGESVTITRILKLPIAGRVSETDRLPSGRPAIQTKSVSVSEWGFKIPMTQFEQNLAHFNMMNPFQASLRDQMALTMDVMAADALKGTLTKFIPTVGGGVFDTDGTPSTLSTKNLGIMDLRKIWDEMHGNLKIPKFRNGKYVGILSTRAARGIKNDPEYKDWLAPTTSEPLISGRMRDVENFALFETNHTEALADLAGSSTTTGEAVFFGADAGFLVVVENPELRAGMTEELGRFREVGWVGTLEAGLTWETAALSRVIHLTSS